MELPKELNFNPWSDNEINSLSKTRDGFYKSWKNTHDRSYYLSYVEAKKRIKTLTEQKIILYFKDKKFNDFQNSKKFYEFYRSTKKLKSDKQNSIIPNFIIKDNNSASEASEISKLLNQFFTDIKSDSVSDLMTCLTSINETFNELSNMFPFRKTFDFHLISVDSVVKLISNLNPNNGPGISDISIQQ
ncbi:hypothetical protein BpHYR1_000936 [Brachionus plicatilis]|uniref:Uncharacterized protein n=1 Tax=Brachionus plicatilis TaxID=10195 RepID=A0A3M7PTV6_BRAPC|nr:hypothetical protein BpHYR1_000936 [Brachionus plicatilis]